jgi:hypothetical protein
MQWKVPCPNDQGNPIGLGAEVGLIEDGQWVPTHIHLLGPGADVPDWSAEYLFPTNEKSLCKCGVQTQSDRHIGF